MRIAFDIDGVLADFSAVFVAQVRRTFRPDLSLDYTQPSDWNYTDILQPGQFGIVFKQCLEIEQFWTTLPAFEENVDALRMFLATHEEANVYYITSRPDSAGGSAASMTQLWLMDHGLSFANLIVVKDPKEKEQHLRDLGIQYFIDDLPSTVRQSQAIEGLKTVLLDRPYNQEATDLPRVLSVAEFLLDIELS